MKITTLHILSCKSYACNKHGTNPYMWTCMHARDKKVIVMWRMYRILRQQPYQQYSVYMLCHTIWERPKLADFLFTHSHPGTMAAMDSRLSMNILTSSRISLLLKLLVWEARVHIDHIQKLKYMFCVHACKNLCRGLTRILLLAS